MTDALNDKVGHLPTGPGVYQHRDATGKVLYVGKAKNLRSRVRSYFREGPREGRLRALMDRVADVDVIVTDTEAEALILENNLIKSLQPKYNVSLRDDKSYPFICIKNERFPRVFPTRRIRKDGSLYFGPYTSAKRMRLMLKTIKDLFKLRSCSLNLHEAAIRAGKYTPCLDYHIQRCAAPCVAYETEEHYNSTIEQVKRLLNGKTDELIGLLKDEMARLATLRRFEEAAELRDRASALEAFSARQKVVSDRDVDRDLFALAVDRQENVAVGVFFAVREGKLLGSHHKILRDLEGVADSELIQRVVDDHYAEATFFPDEVLLSTPAADSTPVEALLRERRGRRVPVVTPERGEKADLIQMVDANAQLLLGEWLRAKTESSEQRVPRSVLALQRDLGLRRPPRRIECFDISHLGGTGTVASCIVFEDGRPKKSEYRTYNVRSVEDGRPDDFQSMREVVQRRYARLSAENGPWPDLVIIDGGKGQLAAAVESMQNTEVFGRFPVVGLAKRLEEVFLPGRRDSVVIPRTSSSLRLLQRARDEAHRFAVTAQRGHRRRTTLRSELMDIPGVGAASVRKLLAAFGSAQAVKEADETAVAAVVGPAIARRVKGKG
jgi:excinuclease ABC subunit C